MSAYWKFIENHPDLNWSEVENEISEDDLEAAAEVFDRIAAGKVAMKENKHPLLSLFKIFTLSMVIAVSVIYVANAIIAHYLK